MIIKQKIFGILSAVLFLSGSGKSQISFYDSGQNLGSSTSWRVAIGDIDNDGNSDAVVSNWHYQINQSSKIWINDGNGIFSEGAQSLPSTQYNASLGDLDSDGDLDMWMNGRVWINDGNGNFTQSSSLYIGGESAIGDLDNDGDLDIVISNFDANANRVYLNDGTANFTGGQYLQQTSAMAAALGYLNNDDDLDAYTVSIANSVNLDGEPDKVWLNNGEGSFYDTGQELDNYQAFNVVLGDVDGDGDFDALVANWHRAPYSTNPQPNRLWINDGDGIFTVSGQDFGTSIVSDVAFGDLDGDGDLDSFIANGESTNDGKANEIRVNVGNGQFQDNGIRLGNSPSVSVALGDMDGDGDLDAFIANCGIFNGGHPNKVWFNNSVTVVVENELPAPNIFELKQNYPNPFNPTTNISYSISEPSYVSIIIYDLFGREVNILVDEYKSIDNYTIDFDGSALSSGIYFYQMKVNNFINTKKMILLR
jgi:hypothetical protein